MHEPEVLFHEEQKFDQLWIRLLIYAEAIGCTILFVWGLIQQLVFKRPWGDNPMSDTGLIITAVLVMVLCWGVFWLFEVMRLRTEVWTDSLYIRFFPFVRTQIPFEDIAEWFPRTYSPIREFGGWGIRWGAGGKAYNVKGNRGVQLVLTNGSRLLIGSQRPEEMAEAIRKARGPGR